MSINNTAKPTTTINNSSRVGYAETWASITTTWASETRAWNDLNFVENTSKVSSNISNTAKP